eukprot:CAMPEP_0172089078 /NCGR_PEP_ID=MMETSP1043-20130122/23597_1 /TAXON_ID=464988 /ORGANISM="Hemiselmis andersenii, Strain CCMP441" /LENGTH=36 /DNA_ID= /DNA_START= /DNA_END= /DNA_ORIENTATION=
MTWVHRISLLGDLSETKARIHALTTQEGQTGLMMGV